MQVSLSRLLLLALSLLRFRGFSGAHSATTKRPTLPPVVSLRFSSVELTEPVCSRLHGKRQMAKKPSLLFSLSSALPLLSLSPPLSLPFSRSRALSFSLAVALLFYFVFCSFFCFNPRMNPLVVVGRRDLCSRQREMGYTKAFQQCLLCAGSSCL